VFTLARYFCSHLDVDSYSCSFSYERTEPHYSMILFLLALFVGQRLCINFLVHVPVPAKKLSTLRSHMDFTYFYQFKDETQCAALVVVFRL